VRLERRVLAWAMTLSILVAVAVSTLTGRDLPGNVAGVVLAALSAAFASDAVAAARRKGDGDGDSDGGS
jgi:drug/metabolite transporter (DMT)-like permease